MKHIISVLVENKSGVLARISGLFSARGYNIDSLAVGETHDPTLSRITLVVHGDDRIIDQVKKQLNKLIDVVVVDDLTDRGYIERDLVIVKVECHGEKKKTFEEMVDKYHMNILDASNNNCVVQIVGEETFVENAIEELKKLGIIELARTGTLALSKAL